MTATEQLLLDTGFHPTTARAFSGFEYDAVRCELHKQDLLAWLPREDRDRRIGMLVMRWRRVKPEVVRQRDTEPPQQTPATRYTLRDEAPTLVQEQFEPLELCEEEPLDPWTERARRLRPQSPYELPGALARALRHAPNDAAALVMAQVSLGVAQRC